MREVRKGKRTSRISSEAPGVVHRRGDIAQIQEMFKDGILTQDEARAVMEKMGYLPSSDPPGSPKVTEPINEYSDVGQVNSPDAAPSVSVYVPHDPAPARGQHVPDDPIGDHNPTVGEPPSDATPLSCRGSREQSPKPYDDPDGSDSDEYVPHHHSCFYPCACVWVFLAFLNTPSG